MFVKQCFIKTLMLTINTLLSPVRVDSGETMMLNFFEIVDIYQARTSFYNPHIYLFIQTTLPLRHFNKVVA